MDILSIKYGIRKGETFKIGSSCAPPARAGLQPVSTRSVGFERTEKIELTTENGWGFWPQGQRINDKFVQTPNKKFTR